MKLLVLMMMILSTVVKATTSSTIPVFLEAGEIYVQGTTSQNSPQVYRPEVQAVLNILTKAEIDILTIDKIIKKAQSQKWDLPDDDEFDEWVSKTFETETGLANLFPLALQVVKIDVRKKADILGKDEIYAYFFITDGVIPTGKVTKIYKGVNSGEAFFFDEIDRAIFPIAGIGGKIPRGHLIVDYGVMKSDGDDVKDLQKLSNIVIDIAISVYAAQNPQQSEVIVSLRKELKALSELLLSLNRDDRLITSSFGYKVEELEDILSANSYHEFKRSHEGKQGKGAFKYDISFRLLRD